ncbi:MAG: hypothetical protein GKR90_11335 [Pseudomonadales bacterium]|nr:hypothetical protein [Pseudomonadales bacterium]
MFTAIAVIVALILAQQLLSIPGNNELSFALTNWLHVFLFTAITAILIWYRPQTHLWQIVVIVCVLGFLTEAVQAFTGRSPSFADLARDLLGMVLALPLYFTFTRKRVLVIAMASLMLSFSLPVTIGASYLAREARLPEIYNATLWDHWLLAESNSPLQLTTAPFWAGYEDNRVAHITWKNTRWPGFHIVEPAGDWTGYERIVVEVFNPDAEQSLTVAVRHEGHRGTSAFKQNTLRPGENRLEVSLDELLTRRHNPDIQRSGEGLGRARVIHLIIHTNQRFRGREIYLGRVYLE